MSEHEEIKLFHKIAEGIRESQRRLFEIKAKLGETVVATDSQGNPCQIPAEEALRRMEAKLKLLQNYGSD